MLALTNVLGHGQGETKENEPVIIYTRIEKALWRVYALHA
jgi:hypothetical protein